MSDDRPLAVAVTDLPVSTGSNYPEPFASRVAGRVRRRLGDPFGLTSFGVNHTTLPPGAESALLHRHSKSQEFVYILVGTPTLVTENDEVELAPGMCAGFHPDGPAHHLVNRSDEPVVYLEIGDRVPGDAGSYPNDDLLAVMGPDGWRFTKKSGSPLE